MLIFEHQIFYETQGARIGKPQFVLGMVERIVDFALGARVSQAMDLDMAHAFRQKDDVGQGFFFGC